MTTHLQAKLHYVQKTCCHKKIENVKNVKGTTEKEQSFIIFSNFLFLFSTIVVAFFLPECTFSQLLNGN